MLRRSPPSMERPCEPAGNSSANLRVYFSRKRSGRPRPEAWNHYARTGIRWELKRRRPAMDQERTGGQENGTAGCDAALPEPAPPRGRVQGAKPTVLMVNDDPRTLRFVRQTLHAEGYAVVETGEPGKVAELIQAERPRLALLDLLLPETDGIELMERIPELSDLPVIFISVYGRDETIARAFEKGAVDYIVKPFSPTELVARVGAALRGRVPVEPFALDGLVIDYERRRVTVEGEEVTLTATEYELLRILSAEAPRVVSTASLLRWAWKGEFDPKLRFDTHRVRTFVRKLRRKLGDNGPRPRLILNEWGVGYRMGAPEGE
ncbi:MAG: response regulator transcription factor [Gammaproteobacteria bacterium]|nr:response regulator transcription factor [Gammaproteobacteria bacterium]MXY91123.1 response regulator transcription factor [Gammaproteobacteria bacterium]MYE30913.1 response regulator transcription factor [Gammaproteobacteria bacterium]MYE99381.1 response regulator transcription factor [Gammaproteobacteria bacterium]MYG97522.1 response regulator transcription factor [Gammaproteobacteria bacterium]